MATAAWKVARFSAPSWRVEVRDMAFLFKLSRQTIQVMLREGERTKADTKKKRWRKKKKKKRKNTGSEQTTVKTVGALNHSASLQLNMKKKKGKRLINSSLQIPTTPSRKGGKFFVSEVHQAVLRTPRSAGRTSAAKLVWEIERPGTRLWKGWRGSTNFELWRNSQIIWPFRSQK